MHHLPRRLTILLVCAIAWTAGARLNAGPWIETAQLVHAGGAAGDGFAPAVAIDGDVAVVGQPNGFFASVFVRSASVWTEAAVLVPSDGSNAVDFGISVAISGDTIVVGAPDETVGDVADEGLAYVFVRPAGGWSGTLQESARLENSAFPDTGPDVLGQSVSISGGTIAVGAPGSFGGAGLAFIFVEPPGGWSGTAAPAAVLEAPAGVSTGFSVGISGDTVIAGAPGTNGNEGAAYVWQKPPEGWSDVLAESADLAPASTPFPNGQFGDAVAIDGTVAVVGSPFALNIGDIGETPVAYVFEMPSTGWAGALNETARMIPDPEKVNLDNPAFGASVSISGDTVVVGTPGLRVFKFSQGDGGAFIFRKPASGWAGDVIEQAKILRIDPSARESFLGRAVAISSSTIVLGAPQETVGANPDQGAAHVFEPGLNPTVTASFSPGSVLTFQPSKLTLTVTNPNTSGFIWNVSAAASISVPAGLFPAAVPNLSNTCGGLWVLGGVVLLGFGNGDPMPAGGTCTISADFSSGTPNTYTTAAFPVSCDQGCDGVGSAPATLLVRLRATQIRVLVQGPVRVAPGVPVEFPFEVTALRESPFGPTGEVVVSDGAGHACRTEVPASGRGACSLTFGGPGTFHVRAQYLGGLSFGASISPPVSVRVGGGG